MTSQDKARLAEWNLTDVEFESDKCVHDLIEAQALLTPGKTAVICRDRSLTYRDLWEKARRLAIHLRELGVGPETIVAIMMDRSLDMMVALLGVLKAGGAYLPLDPAFPAERIAFMLKDSDARVALTQSSYRNRLAESSATVLALDEFDFDDERTDPREMLTNVQPASSLAYLIYTSGSTGTPKGVMVEHRNVVSFFAGMDRVIGVEQGVWLAVTSISFDISVLELLWTLSRGFTVVLQTGEERPGCNRRLLDRGSNCAASGDPLPMHADSREDRSCDFPRRYRRCRRFERCFWAVKHFRCRWRIGSGKRLAPRFSICTGQPRRRCGRLLTSWLERPVQFRSADLSRILAFT